MRFPQIPGTTKSRIKEIINEELHRNASKSVKEAVGIQGHEPEDIPAIDVNDPAFVDRLVQARHAAYYLIKETLESGADSVSLEGTVRDVYGYNVPSYILELFSDDE